MDKITAILYTVVFSPAFFRLLSRERYNIQIRRPCTRPGAASFNCPPSPPRAYTVLYIHNAYACTHTYVCTYNSRAFVKFVRTCLLSVFCVCTFGPPLAICTRRGSLSNSRNAQDSHRREPSSKKIEFATLLEFGTLLRGTLPLCFAKFLRSIFPKSRHYSSD